MTVEEIGIVLSSIGELGDVIHESTYHNAVLREQPDVDSFEKSWMSWKDLVLNFDTYSELWYPDDDPYVEYDQYDQDSEESFTRHKDPIRDWQGGEELEYSDDDYSGF